MANQGQPARTLVALVAIIQTMICSRVGKMGWESVLGHGNVEIQDPEREKMKSERKWRKNSIFKRIQEGDAALKVRAI